MMHPKKVKNLIQEICEKKQLPLEDMLLIIPEVYKRARKKMEDFEDHYIQVEGLGTFEAKLWKVQPEIVILQQKLSTNYSLDKLVVFKILSNKLERMKVMEETILRAWQDRQESVKKARIVACKEVKEHVPSYYQYNKGCRCEGCKRARGAKEKRHREEKQRIKALKEKKDGKDKGTLEE